MRKIITLIMALFSFLAFICNSSTSAQTPYIQWEKAYGGLYTLGYAIQQTYDGGYIMAGTVASVDSGDVRGSHGGYDYWVVKINANGDTSWTKCLGGTGYDWCFMVTQTSDSGYLVDGYTTSNDGDVTGNHGGEDIWVVKLTKSGAISWQKALGGSKDEIANSLQSTFDGGCIVTGYTNSSDGDVTKNQGGYDFWIIKLNDTGGITWQKTFGGPGDDIANFTQQTKDSGYIVAGLTNSNSGDVSGSHGGDDMWVLRLDDTGALIWQKCYGGSNDDVATGVQQMADSNFIVVGYTSSIDGDVKSNHGDRDYWALKITDTGAIQWERTYGGTRTDIPTFISPTIDNGCLIAGFSNSNNGDVVGNHGMEDYWIIKINDSGSIKWSKSLGGTQDDECNGIQQTTDTGYIVIGFTGSNDEDVTGNTGEEAFWVVKLKDSSDSVRHVFVPIVGNTNKINVYPTRTHDVVYIDLPPGYEGAQIKVFSETGQEININQNSSLLHRQLYFDNTPTGMYVIRISNASDVKSFKILYTP